jgi:hypothetical protein
MSRTRAYTRKMRAKAIKRKKRIVSNWRWFENGYYPHDGMYSKNKIHCSCPLCKSKAYYGKHVFTFQEVQAILKLKEAERECTYNEAPGTFSIASGNNDPNQKVPWAK